ALRTCRHSGPPGASASGHPYLYVIEAAVGDSPGRQAGGAGVLQPEGILASGEHRAPAHPARRVRARAIRQDPASAAVPSIVSAFQRADLYPIDDGADGMAGVLERIAVVQGEVSV